MATPGRCDALLGGKALDSYPVTVFLISFKKFASDDPKNS
jgi:hypothetical protein